MKLYGLWGIGGFGRETMPIAEEWLAATEKDKYELVFVVDEPARWELHGHKVMASAAFLADANDKYFNVAIADSKARQRIVESAIRADAWPFSIQAPNCRVYPSSSVGDGAILGLHTTVTADAKIGRFFHANIYSFVAHDCVIGDYVTFAPRVSCNGGVVIKDHAYIGTGVVIRQASKLKPIVIGEGAVVGMGAVVTKSVPDGATVVGNPARVKA
jgi:sugar O-acyltransferase (sialic acid O-acetyltransferase NeuD family)